jgi:DNA polymerase-3 subunit delta'
MEVRDMTSLLGGERMIGNEALREQLQTEILDGRLSHAYILEGARGTGKHLLAMEICAAISCLEKGERVLPCGHCRSCEKILQGKSPDIHVIGKNGKASIGVDDVRFLRADVLVLPNDLEHRFFIIEDAQDMTVQAQNALLLTLEEPPAHVVFLLLCENSANILETIRSRAPSRRLCPVPNDRLKAYLTKTQRAFASLPNEEQDELICMAGGSVGQALSLLDGRARKPLIERRRFAAQVVQHGLRSGRRDTAASMELIFGFGTVREEVASVLSLMQEALRDLILLKKSDNAPLLFYADRTLAQELSQASPVAALSALMQATEYTRTRILRNANVKLALSELLLSDASSAQR